MLHSARPHPSGPEWEWKKLQRSSAKAEGKPAPDPFEAAIRLLAFRPHSRQELARKLRLRGCGPEAIELALDRAGDLGYLDDAAYARSLVRLKSGSRGRAAIGAELAARGISRELAAEVLSELEPEVQLEAAVKLLSRMPLATARPELLLARLQRRGFSPQVARAAWRALQPD